MNDFRIPLRAWCARDGVVSSGECDSQFTLSTAIFVVLGATRNMKSACVEAAVLVASANDSSPAIYQLMIDHLKTKYGRSAKARSPGTTNRLQMRHALFSAPLARFISECRTASPGGIKILGIDVLPRLAATAQEKLCSKSHSGSSVKEKTYEVPDDNITIVNAKRFCCSEQHVFPGAGIDMETFSQRLRAPQK